MNTTVIPHPPYSPDLVTCDFSLFPKMKLKVKRRRFDSIEEIQTESQNAMKTLTRNNFQKCPLESLYPCQRGLLRRGRVRMEISVRG
jgi:hypothetical protein